MLLIIWDLNGFKIFISKTFQFTKFSFGESLLFIINLTLEKIQKILYINTRITCVWNVSFKFGHQIKIKYRVKIYGLEKDFGGKWGSKQKTPSKHTEPRVKG